MASFSPVDAAVSSSTTIGRYFAVVSVVPSALLVLFVALLLGAGSWDGPVDPSRIGDTFAGLGVADLAWFVTASLAVALLIHPLKFPTTQLLEGYWGTGSLGLRLTAAATRRHHRKVVRLLDGQQEAYVGWVLRGSAMWREEQTLLDPAAVHPEELAGREQDARLALSLPAGEELLALYQAQQAYEKARTSYPNELHRIMPTRLGNVLRQSEDRAGKQYGLDTMVIAPHLSLVAKPDHYAYVEDRQKGVDLAITMCLVASIATALSAVLLADDGWWSLLSFGPLGVAYASYLGAVAAASGYNVALETVTDLSRFGLYAALHVAPPTTGKQERRMAGQLMALLRGEAQPSMKFVAPEPPAIAARHADCAAVVSETSGSHPTD